MPRELLAEGVRLARVSAVRHPYRQIVPLHVGRVVVGVLSFARLRECLAGLLLAEYLLCRLPVRLELVGRDVRSFLQSTPNVSEQSGSRFGVPLPGYQI